MARAGHLAKRPPGAYSASPMVGPYYMDAVITPHRSLSARGLIILIAVLTAINMVSALIFVVMGAGPIPIFLGLDVLAVLTAFAVSNRAATQKERVQVTAIEVRVLRQWPRGAQTVWVSPTAATRVIHLGAAGDDDQLHLTLEERRLRVAAALSRPERAEFAKALDRAIWRARVEGRAG